MQILGEAERLMQPSAGLNGAWARRLSNAASEANATLARAASRVAGRRDLRLDRRTAGRARLLGASEANLDAVDDHRVVCHVGHMVERLDCLATVGRVAVRLDQERAPVLSQQRDVMRVMRPTAS